MTGADTFCQDELCEEKPAIKQEQHPIHPPSELKSLGERLRDHRLRLGLSQEALASAIGASARSIHRWERNLAIPQEHSRSRLCHVFGIDPQQLLESWLAQETSSATHPSPLWCV